MTRRLPFRMAVAALGGLLALGLAGCGDDDDDAADDPTIEAPDAEEGGGDEGGGPTLAIEGSSFGDLSVEAGEEVTVENADGVPHTVTADGDEFNVALDPNGTGTFMAPDEPGEYPFHCNVHSSMKGTLTVT